MDIEAIYRLLVNLSWNAKVQPSHKDKTYLQSLKLTLTNLHNDAYNKGVFDCQEVSSKYRRSQEEINEINNLLK